MDMVESQVISLLDEALKQHAKLRKNGDQALYFCKCGHYKRKLEVSVKNLIFHCWVCDAKGNLNQLLKFFDAPEYYYNKLKGLVGNRKRIVSVAPSTKITLPDEFESLQPKSDSPEYKNAIHYLKGRNVGEIDIIRHNIGYCTSGIYEGKIIVPSYDANCNLNFFIGRDYYNNGTKYPFEKPKCSMNIVGFESLLNYRYPLNLCEGVFDAIAIRNNAIPLFGKYISQALLTAIITNNVSHINIVLDNDALNDAIKNYCILKKTKSNLTVNIVKLKKKDPSEIGFNKIHTLIKDSTEFEFADLIEYNIQNR